MRFQAEQVVPGPAAAAIVPPAVVSAAVVLEHFGPRATLSHETAARLHGLELADPGLEHVTVPRSHSRSRADGWQVHRRDVPACDRTVLGGQPVTSVLRTVADLARALPLAGGLAVADSALRQRRSTPTALAAGLAGLHGPGSGRARLVAGLASPLSDSVLESLAAAVFLEAGLPSPLRQHEISDADGRLVARADFCWPAARLVVEVDGFAFHSDRAAYRRDRERSNALVRLGWRVLRFTYEDIRSRPQLVVAAVRGCLVRTVAA